jgi:hypothetical protein
MPGAEPLKAPNKAPWFLNPRNLKFFDFLVFQTLLFINSNLYRYTAAHGTELLSLFHLPFALRSFSSRPFKSTWWGGKS